MSAQHRNSRANAKTNIKKIAEQSNVMINTISVEPFTKKCIYWISLYARVHIPVLCHIWTLGKSSMNSFTSGNPGELSTSSTLLRKAWMEEKRRRLTVHHMQRTKSILSLSE